MAQEITEDLLYSPISKLASLLRGKTLSSMALTEAYLDRLGKYGGKLGAVAAITANLARTEAAAADKEIKAGNYRGPLHGIPYGVKDLLATRGIPTTWGAEPYKDQVFDYDASVIVRLREAGAVLVAKLAMIELAGGFGYNQADASVTGPARTPWNPRFWAGGSSSGPGAAVAAALVPFAIGSETSGSIITPAAYSGISGLRPSFGRVSRHGAMALSWALDKLGPMCRTADDCGLVLAAIAGKDPLDASTSARPFIYPEDKKGKTGEKKGKLFKVGIIKDSTESVQPAVKRNFEAAVEVVREFAEVDENVPFPEQPFNEVVTTIVEAEGASAFRDLIEDGRCQKLRAPSDRWGGYPGTAVLAVDYLQALRLLVPMKKALDELYAKYDALIAPSRATVAYPIGIDFDRAYPGMGNGGPDIIPAGNAAGQPALSVPNGFGPNNLPTGIQFTGRIWSESRIIALADAYQQATDWHKKKPKLSE